MAAGLSQATATGFLNAPKFSTPGNSDSFCLDDWKSGFDWSDLVTGSFDSYKGFKWSGFTCEDKFTKRDTLSERTFQNKCIVGKATTDKSTSPNISCDKSKGAKDTSIKEFQVHPEFDCDLEFHYTMPDGSSCKHRSACSKDGTTVKNSQCGGATDVTIVFPEQPAAPSKSGCDFAIPSIVFDCGSASSTATRATSTATASYPAGTPPVSTTSSAVVITTSSAAASSSTAVESSTTAVETPSSSGTTPGYPAITPPASETTSSVVETVSSAIESASSATEATSSGIESTTSAVESTTSAIESASTSVATEATTFTSVTSYITTSTVFSTMTSVITSCGPSVTNCPGNANNTATVTSVIAISTTVCPVTETITSVSSPASVPSSYSTTGLPATTESTAVPSTSATSATEAASSSTAAGSSTSPATPIETLPCPGVVPSCLNTWLSTIGCTDNTDSACYCPDSTFVDNVFDCLYSHGESDEDISEAISYFQGICAPHASQNPGIVTYPATITTILTATATAPPTAVYTTIEVVATTVVPCTGSAGESSSSTVTISTQVSVPDVGFTTVSNSAGSTSVVFVPGPTTAPVAVGTTPAAVAPSTTAAETAPYPTGVFTTLTTPAPIAGTGSVYPTSTPSIVTAGAARIGAGIGFLGAVAMAVVAL
ncbi:hypothetical protein SLS62_001464 [Diatrype stigma]|uniref:CFEM domain-containing protein n=1 Tax=Diatrype stigma TaxID=117547 RepID=A0AAN9V086_9PEZI